MSFVCWYWVLPLLRTCRPCIHFANGAARVSLPLPVPFVPAVPAIVEHAGCQTAARANTYQCEKHHYFDSSGMFHGTFLPRAPGKRSAISLWRRGDQRLWPHFLLSGRGESDALGSETTQRRSILGRHHFAETFEPMLTGSDDMTRAGCKANSG
jgi:hypothetical protein